ncbi:hypothetical protein E4U21_002959 [Claviceps maximensis]|nr:hypothetical protein E4U21_002959 [Claviceps maximensis]
MADFKKASLAFLAAVIAPALAANLPDGVIAVPLTRGADFEAYHVEFQVGTPPQKERLKVDTGSPRYAFMNPRNPICARPGNPCSISGTFDNTTSSTCRFEDINFADDLGPVGMGDYLSDTLVLGGVTMKDMYFGYTSLYGFPNRIADRPNTILGMALECGPVGTSCTGKGAYFLPELKNASLIDRMSASFYLGPDDAVVPHAKMILGGAYDKAKVKGKLFTMDMVDPYDAHLTDRSTNYVNVTGLRVVLHGNQSISETYGPKGVGEPVLLDSGTARWYLPQTIFDVVFKALGGDKNNAAAPGPGSWYQRIDCKYRDAKNVNGFVEVQFGAAGAVQVPLNSLVGQFADGSCGSFIIPQGDSVNLFGDPFLRGVYSIFDQENWTVTLGNVKHTAEENIVPFPAGGFKARA